jgi:iron complex outermembrane receptor protein
VRSILLNNQTTWNFAENWSVKNTFSYSKSKYFTQTSSISGAPLLIFDAGSPKNNTPTSGRPQWTDEILVTGKAFDVLDLTIGTFHNLIHNNPKVNYSLFLGNLESAAIQKTSNWNHSVFAQGNLDLGDFVEGLTLTAGYRQSWDGVKAQTWNLNPATLAVISTSGGPNSPSGHAHFSTGSYTVGLQYQYTPDVMFYVTNSKGSSSGGLQNVTGFETYQPDSLNNLEAGVKGTFEWLGVKQRINAEYYHGWYSGVKSIVNALVTNSAGAQSITNVTANAASAIIQGIDASYTIAPSDALEVSGFMAYTDPHYTSYPSRDPTTLQPIDLSSSPFLFVPKFKWGISGTYHLPLDSDSIGDVSITANYTWSGRIAIDSKPAVPTDPTNPNTGFVCSRARTAANGYGPNVVSQVGGVAPVDCKPGYDNLDLGVDWRNVLNHDGLDLSLKVTNVTENTGADGVCGCNTALGVLSYTPAVPRMFYLALNYNF